VIEVSKSNSNTTRENGSTDSEPDTATNVALHQPAKTRLTAYKNDNPLKNMSFDKAVDKLLDEIGFPPVEEIENKYLPSVAAESSSDAEDERPNNSA
jgi:hypothetical protein